MKFREIPPPAPNKKDDKMSEGRKNILRMFGTDIPGDVSIKDGLRHMKGISFSTSSAILDQAGIDPTKMSGDIDEEEKTKLQDTIKNCKIPEYLLNRRKDPEDGESKMLVSTDLDIQHREDINSMKKLGTYRGMRHRRGLPVRGQKTQSSFRGDSSVGVSTEKIKKKS